MFQQEDLMQDTSKAPGTRIPIFISSSGTVEALLPIELSDDEWRARLTLHQFDVARKKGTEYAFTGKYHNIRDPGIYRCACCGTDLFDAKAKFDSGTGWPSFTKPLEPANVTVREDRSYHMSRVEVRSTLGNSHLGHLFDDGPVPTGKRYCMNSASLRFIPKEDLEKEGYGEYRKLFEKK